MALPNASAQLAELLSFGQGQAQGRSSQGGSRRGATERGSEARSAREPRSSETPTGVSSAGDPRRRSGDAGVEPDTNGWHAGGAGDASGDALAHGGGLLSGVLGARRGSGSNSSPRPPREASPAVLGSSGRDRGSSSPPPPQGPSHVREPAEEDWAGSALDEEQARAFERSLGLAVGSLAPQSLVGDADANESAHPPLGSSAGTLSGACGSRGEDAPYGGSDGGEAPSSYHASYHSSYHEPSYLLAGAASGALDGATAAQLDASVSSRARPARASSPGSGFPGHDLEGASPTGFGSSSGFGGGFGSPAPAAGPAGAGGSPGGSAALAGALSASGEPSMDAWGATPSPSAGLASLNTPASAGGAEDYASRALGGPGLASPYGSTAVSSVGRSHHHHHHHHRKHGRTKHGRGSPRNSPRAGPSPRATGGLSSGAPSAPAAAWSDAADDSFWAMRGAGGLGGPGIGSPLGSGIGVGASPLGSGDAASASPLGSSAPAIGGSPLALEDAYSSGLGSAYGALYGRSGTASLALVGGASSYGADVSELAAPPDAEGAALLSSTAPGSTRVSRDLDAALGGGAYDDLVAETPSFACRAASGGRGGPERRSDGGAAATPRVEPRNGSSASSDVGFGKGSAASDGARGAGVQAPQARAEGSRSAASSPRASSLILPFMALSDRMRGRRRGRGKDGKGDGKGGAGGGGPPDGNPPLSALSPGLPGGPARALPKGATKTLAVRRWLSVDREGRASLLDLGKLKVMLTLGVQLRDLRLLDPLLATSYPSAILARDRAIVVNMEFVKAIITADAVLVTNLDDPAALAFVQLLRTRLAAAAQAERVARELSGGPGPYPGYGGMDVIREDPVDPTMDGARGAGGGRDAAAAAAAQPAVPPRAAPKASLPRPTSAAQLALASVAVAPVAPDAPLTAIAPGKADEALVGLHAAPGVGVSAFNVPAPGVGAAPAPAVAAPSASAAISSSLLPELAPPPAMTDLPHLAPAGSAVPPASLPLPPALVDLPFEHRALEVVLESVCGHLGALSGELESVAHPALDALTSGVDTARLETVRRVKTRLVRLTTRVETAREVLERFLDDDSDMKDLNLTAREEERREQEAADRAAAEREAERAASSARGARTPGSLAGRLGPSRLNPSQVARLSRHRVSRRSSTPRRRKGKGGGGGIGSGGAPVPLHPHVPQGNRAPATAAALASRAPAGLPPAPRNWRPRGPLGRLVPWSPSHRWPGFAGGAPEAPPADDLAVGPDGDGEGYSSSDDSSSQTSEEVEAVERLLEQYFMRLDATRHRLKTLCEYIEDTEDYVNIELDSIRNDIFRFDLFISSVTASVAIVIAVTSLFAMNLELHPNVAGQGPYSWFLAISISLCSFTVFFFVGIIAFCKHKGLY